MKMMTGSTTKRDYPTTPRRVDPHTAVALPGWARTEANAPLRGPTWTLATGSGIEDTFFCQLGGPAIAPSKGPGLELERERAAQRADTHARDRLRLRRDLMPPDHDE